MKAFVTGGNGFIGKKVVRKLIERGYQVTALARSEKSAAALQAMGAEVASGDITDRESMRAGMLGSDVVFHLAAWYKLGGRDWQQAETINVEGTRNVLGLAQELGVPKIVYTSTVGIFSDTHGQIADESYHKQVGQPFLTEYEHTKWKAHYEVALPFIKQGVPIIIVQPGAVYGPGDTSLVGQLMMAYYRGLFPLFPGPETVLAYTHVEDVAEGHLLAAEKGRPGESYLLTGECLSLKEASRYWSEASGKPMPIAYVPSILLKPMIPIARVLSMLLPMPEMLSVDGLNTLGATYAARSDKARAQLGWTTRPLEEGFRETFDWIAGKASEEPLLTPQRKRNLAFVLAGLAVLFILTRRRRK